MKRISAIAAIIAVSATLGVTSIKAKPVLTTGKFFLNAKTDTVPGEVKKPRRAEPVNALPPQVTPNPMPNPNYTPSPVPTPMPGVTPNPATPNVTPMPVTPNPVTPGVTPTPMPVTPTPVTPSVTPTGATPRP